VLKILFEEPVAYSVVSKDVLSDNEWAWVYKNPTKREAGEILEISKDMRVLVHGCDYYVASAYYFIHASMARALKIPLREFDTEIFIDGKYGLVNFYIKSREDNLLPTYLLDICKFGLISTPLDSTSIVCLHDSIYDDKTIADVLGNIN